MNIKEVIYDLSYDDEILLVDEIKYAREHQEIIIPELINMLEYTMDNLDDIIKGDSSFSGYIYAIYLLAEFRCKELYPFLIKLMHEGEDCLDYILGDDFVGWLSSLLASSYNGDDKALLDIIFDSNTNEFIRICCLSVFSILYLEGVKDRKFVLDLIDKFVDHIDNEKLIDNCLYDLTLCEIVDLKLIELSSTVDKLRKKISDDEFIMEFDKLVKNQDKSLNRDIMPLYRHYDYIRDCIDIMEEWAYFSNEEDFICSYEYKEYNEIKKRRELNQVKYGRNDLCYCGSGKKYKKCCIDKYKERNKERNDIDYHLAWAEYNEFEDNEKSAAMSYRIAFFDTINYCKKYGITIIDDFDYEYESYLKFSDWLDDYLMLLSNFQTRHYNYDILKICDYMEKTFDLKEDDYWKKQIYKEKADALVFLGKIDEATNIIKNVLKDNPKWTFGYISMSDWYDDYFDIKPDYNKSIEILEKGLSKGITEDLDCIYERLIYLYTKIDNKDKIKYYQNKLIEYNDIIDNDTLPF